MTSQGVVVVTGASGFVATYVVKDLLENGYKVRGTVRSLTSKDKYSHLLDLPHAKENLELMEADLLVDGSFDQVVKGSVAVFHTASPFFFGATDPQKQLIEPALNGTRNVLSAVVKNLETVKRVIVTSSVAAVYNPTTAKPGVYNEEIWNTESSLTDEPYCYSKALAEREAWKFAQEYNISLTTVNPPFIFGPVLAKDRVKEETELNTSNAYLKRMVTSSSEDEVSPVVDLVMVDVRDVAKVHRLAYETDATSGHRLICSAGTMSQAKLSQTLLRLFPQHKNRIPSKIQFTDAVKTIEDGAPFLRYFSSAKLQQLIPDFQFTPIETTLQETVVSLENEGLLQ